MSKHMSNSKDGLSALFSSLRPDNSKTISAASSALNAAQNKWPLLKATSLAAPEPTPEISKEEKQHRRMQQNSASQVRQPVLSLPSTNDMLAFNLDRIAQQSARATVVKHMVRIENAVDMTDLQAARGDEMQPSEILKLKPSKAKAPKRKNSPVKSTSVMPSAPKEVSSLPMVLKREIESPKAILSNKGTVRVKSELLEADQVDNTLKRVFGRIQAKDQTTDKAEDATLHKVDEKPAEKLAVFFDRLRKR